MKAQMKRFNPTILVREEIFLKQNLTMPTRAPARLLKNPAIQKRGASFSSIKSKMNYKVSAPNNKESIGLSGKDDWISRQNHAEEFSVKPR